MRAFLFLRHGETDWNKALRMQGQTHNIPLNEKGVKQVRAAAAILKKIPFDLILTSPLLRALETAKIIASVKDAPIVPDARLMERGFGIAEGLTLEEYAAANPKAAHETTPNKPWFLGEHTPEGGESLDDLQTRASNAALDLLEEHKGKRLLLVTHGAWLRVLTRALTKTERTYPNAIPFRAQETPGGWTIAQVDESQTG